MRDTKNNKKIEAEVKEEVVDVDTSGAVVPSIDAEVDKPNTESKNSNKKVLGKIFNCKALNIRKEPSLDGEVVCTVKAGNELVIRDSTSIPEWYAVTEKYGFEGYAMSKYIRIKK